MSSNCGAPCCKVLINADLDFKGQVKAKILDLLRTVPTIVVLHRDRPAVIPEIDKSARALLAECGASDLAVLDIIFGKANPEVNLPFDLRSSMEAVRNQKIDVPADSENPLHPSDFGLSY